MARTTDIDWVEIAARLLIEEGHTALTLERLCATAGRTRGSFYHHHVSISSLKTALLARWAIEHTEALIQTSEAIGGSTEDKRQQLDMLALALDFRLEQAMRNWAAYDAETQNVVHDVDRRRIDYLTALEREGGEADPLRARKTALLHYALYLGFQQLPGETERDEMRSTAATLKMIY